MIGIFKGYLIDRVTITFNGKRCISAIEHWLEFEKDQLPLWFPILIGAGIGLWQLTGSDGLFVAMMVFASLALAGVGIGYEKRSGRLLIFASLALSIGFASIELKSASVAGPVLGKVWTGSLYGRIEKIEVLGARSVVRLELSTNNHHSLPDRVRINVGHDQFDTNEFGIGSVIKLRARLMPPAMPALPGSYDFARRAWFRNLGATGSALGPVIVYKSSENTFILAEARASLTQHIIDQMPEGTGEIGAALITGDQANIDENDAQAMRDSGMAHLLSISGLHVTAVVGFLFFLFSRVFALVPAIALRFPVPLLSAGVAALGAVGYTVLAGAEVPTVRSCIAALLVLLALALGREALTLRLVAFGAVIVLVFWPESLAGPSFQLSFAAVTTIVVLHESKWMKSWTENKGYSFSQRIWRGLLTLVITGFAIELMLAPIALFHFHRTGLYSAIANVLAIPLTTFVIMPAQALALIFDVAGLGWPAWWIAGQGIALIVELARFVSSAPGAVSMMPAMPVWAYIAMILGGINMGLWKSRVRYLGMLPVMIGAVAMLASPRPDILVTGDGKHLAFAEQDGRVTLLRGNAGEYIKDMLLESVGTLADPLPIERWPGATCSPDICIIDVKRQDRNWRVLATRTPYPIPAMEMAAACKRVDIVVSDRWLPSTCKPTWIKADRKMLEASGGLAIYLARRKIVTVNENNMHLPWVKAAKIAQERQTTH